MEYKIGQVLNFKSNSFFSKSISMGLGHYWTHSAWIVDVKENIITIQEADSKRFKRVIYSKYTKAQLNDLVAQNRLKIMDFGINNDVKFQNYYISIDGRPYDFYSVSELGFARIISFFGLNAQNWLGLKFLNGFKKLFGRENNAKRLDCAEAIGRGIQQITRIDILYYSNQKVFDFVTPQDLSNVYDRLIAERNYRL